MATSVEARAGDLVDRLGASAVAGLLGVHRSQPSRWRSGRGRPSLELRARILDLSYALERLLELYTEDVAVEWMQGSNAHMGGRRPIDVVRSGRITEVIEAIDAEAGLAFA